MDWVIAFLVGAMVGVLIMAGSNLLFLPVPFHTAQFICETHELDLIDFEIGSPTFKEVECGNTKSQYENYKVFK